MANSINQWEYSPNIEIQWSPASVSGTGDFSWQKMAEAYKKITGDEFPGAKQAIVKEKTLHEKFNDLKKEW